MRTVVPRMSTAAWLLLAACSGGVAPAGEPAAAFFSPGLVHEVSIRLDPDDWERLRRSSRPYPYFPADLTIDGHRLPWVGLRKKGTAGSLSDTRPALKVRLDRYARGRRFLGLRRLTLNNALQDGARLRQCLAYRLYRRAGVPAPRCNFARVTVNGRDLGIYANVETIDEVFLARLYPGPAVLYEGNYTDLDAGWRSRVERKTPATGPGEVLDRLVGALYLPEGDLLPALARLLDLEEFFRFWALTVLMANTDSFHSNGGNFYLAYEEAAGRFHFIPWGADEGFSPPSPGSGLLWVAGPLLVKRLLALPAGRARYLDTLRDMLAKVWRERQLLDWIDEVAGKLAAGLFPAARAGFREQLEVVRGFLRDRRRNLLEEMAPARTRPPPGFLLAERPLAYFAPFRTGSAQTVCTRLYWGGPGPLSGRAFSREAALAVRLEEGAGGPRLCVTLRAPARPGRHLVLVRPRGQRRALSPLQVVTLPEPRWE